MAQSNYTYTTTDSQFIGRSNPLDNFNAYPDFPVTNAILQPRESSWAPTTLGTTVKVYHGSQADISALAVWSATKWFSYNAKELPGQEFEITITVPYDELTNTDNTAPETVQWEFLPNTVARSIFDAGIFYVSPGGQLSTHRYTVPPTVQAAIMLAVTNNGSLSLVSDKKYAPLAGIAEQFYNIIKGGTTSVRAYTNTAKRTAVFSVLNPNAYDNYPLIETINEANTINPVISSKDLATLFQIPETQRLHLIPSYARIKTSSQYGDPATTVARGGYLIGRPQTVFLTPTKVQIIQLFEFDEWLDTLYPTVSDPVSGFPVASNTPYPPGYTGSP